MQSHTWRIPSLVADERQYHERLAALPLTGKGNTFAPMYKHASKSSLPANIVHSWATGDQGVGANGVILKGVNFTATILSAPFTSTPVHIEDGKLGAANWLVAGFRKIWYIILGTSKPSCSSPANLALASTPAYYQPAYRTALSCLPSHLYFACSFCSHLQPPNCCRISCPGLRGLAGAEVRPRRFAADALKEPSASLER